MHALTGIIKTGDITLFLLLNRKLRCKPMDLLMTIVTQLGSTAFSIALAALFLLSENPYLNSVGVQLAATLICGQIIVQTVKRLVNRPRPFRALAQTIAVKPPACKYSFPSGHSCAAFCIAFVLASAFTGLGAVFLLMAALVSTSRIYLGFHYPTDVVVGYLIAHISYFVAGLLPLFLL